MAPSYEKASGMALASLILGIFSFCCCCFNVITGVLAIIFGFVELSRINGGASSEKGRWMAITGIVLGFISVAKDLVGGIWLLFFFGGMGVLQGLAQSY